MIRYTTDVNSINSQMLKGFFVDWPNPPSSETHLELLRQSDEVTLAVDGDTNQVIGFITAISDRVLTAYIPLLEVLPGYQSQGIGSALIAGMLNRLRHLNAIDLICDPEMMPYYEKAGLQPATGMMVRHYENQAGSKIQS
jgi:ribosomal protein S18 acetylase RimI-like enzyme